MDPALVKTARGLALYCLITADANRSFATDLLDEQLRTGELPARERGLATELVYGVVRRQATLAACLRPHLNKTWSELEVGLRWLLLLGAYQLLFCDGIPDHAAVHETVELAKLCGHPRWTGFANALLRALAQAIQPEGATRPGRNTVPISAGTYRLLSTSPFPDPAIDTVGWYAHAFGMPAWLVARWSTRFTPTQILSLCDWFNHPLQLSLRVNRLKTTRAEIVAAFTAAGYEELFVSEVDGAILRVGSPGGIAALPGFHEGLFAIQDESALAAARLLAPKAGEQVLDLCAAPGGKTAALAELAADLAHIVATDVDHARLKLVRETAARLGLKSIQTQPIARNLSDLPTGPFDAILLDAPCSNTGVLGKRPEARHRLTPNDLPELAGIQRNLLTAAAARLKPGGRIVYSTCSIEPEENEDLVAAFLRDHPELTLVSQTHHHPGQPADGAYQALLVSAK